VDWTYRDFIAQEQKALGNEEAKRYFAAMLEEAPAEQLPRLSGVGGKRRQAWFFVAPFQALSGDLIRLAKGLGVPAQAVLQAAHFKVLSTVSGQRRVVSCVTYNGRPEAEGAERSLGLFVNSVPISMEVEPGSWRELILRVAQAGTASMKYRGYPLSKIQQDLGWTFSEVLFNYTHFHVYNDLTKSAERSLEALGSSGFEETNFDLMVEVSREMNDTMVLGITYDAGVWAENFIRQLGQYYVRAFEQMLDGLEKPHQGQPLLSAEEQRRLLVNWNATDVEYEVGRQCVQELFEAQVERSPEAVAVVYKDWQLSYGELNRRANRLAHYLREQGVGPDTLVGLCVERSPEMVVGILGILKAGGAYVPLEPSYPVERLQFMLQDSAPVALLTQPHLKELFPNLSKTLHVLDLAPSEAAWKDQPEVNPDRVTVGQAMESLAYVIYTSGSAGKPKGVQITHRSLVNLLCSMSGRPGINPDDVWLAETNLSFDMSVPELYLPLVVGACMKIIDREAAMDGALLLQELDRGVTVFQATPTTWSLLLESGWKGSPALKALCGAEALPADLAKKLVGRCNSLWNMYGPTETTVWSMAEKIEEGVERICIGRPIANTQVYVLDEDLQPAPPGVAGELYIGGTGLARGYLKRDDLTAERFVPNPFTTEAGARLYRSGDQARWMEEGTLQFLGRKDNQVKIRGFRIELGEIEHQLSGLPGVSGAVVLGREDVSGEKRLVAYVATSEYPAEEEEQSAIKAGLIAGYRQALAARLPHYMAPSMFVLLKEFPLTPNGKLDRKALPAYDNEFSLDRYLAPTTRTEISLARIWANVLKRDSKTISADADFFSLGGNSILAMYLVLKVNKDFGNMLQLRHVFEMPTIGDMAAYLDVHGHQEDQEKLAARSHLLELKSGQSSANPLFLIHPLSGYSACYSELAAHLDYEGSVFGLQTNEQIAETIELMASKYVTAIKAVQPSGPYLLGGWSMGGVVAYEMARQLKSLHENVDLLLMLDAFCPENKSASPDELVDDQRAPLELKALELGMKKESLDEMTLEELFVAVLDLGKQKNQLPENFGMQELKARHAAWVKHTIAHRAYRPLPLDQEIQLIRAEDNTHSDWSLGWASVATKVVVTKQSGSHALLVSRPYVVSLANTVSAIIQNVSKSFQSESVSRLSNDASLVS
jgi:amino acid adenylation domain-containing protein